MSHLRLLLSTACRQYASLTLNRCSGSTSVLKSSLHCSPCLNLDVSSLIDQEKPAEQKKPEKKVFTEAPIDPDYLPGGEYIPSESTYDHVVDGVRYDELPRIYVKATYQNTLASAHTKTNECLSYQSGKFLQANSIDPDETPHDAAYNLGLRCLPRPIFVDARHKWVNFRGRVGFKNSKKKSAVCGQTVGLAIGMDLLKKGHKNACIIVSGQGAGRMAAMKGVQLAGVNIVSITDMTFPNVTSRPRKPRRL